MSQGNSGPAANFLGKCSFSQDIMQQRPTFEPQSILSDDAVLSEPSPVEQYHHLKALYQDMTDIIAEIFIQMSDSVSQVPAQVPAAFEWNPQVIWRETSQVTEWGFYLAFYPQGTDVIGQLNELTVRAYHSLRAGKSTDFAESLADSYRLILTSVQAYMAEKYKFTEALSVPVPRRDAFKDKR